MIETLINDYFVKERAFYHLNERFVSNITGDTIFLRQGLRNALRLVFTSDGVGVGVVFRVIRELMT